MKIYMLNPPFVPKFCRPARWQERARGGTIYYPIWLAYATGLLEKEGHRVKLVDAPARSLSIYNILKDIEKFKPDLIVIEASFTSLNNDLKIAREIKALNISDSDTKVVVVGPPASQFTEYILRNGADIVARYEYDWTLANLVKQLEENSNLTKVLGISYVSNESKIIHNPNRQFSKSKDLDSLPMVSRVYAKHLNIYDYYLSSSLYPEVQIFTSRGCPFRCTFCAWPQTFMGRIIRYRSINNIIEELYWIKRKLPFVKEVVFEDDTFSVNKHRVRMLCKRIIEEDIDIIWNCQTRADVDFETLKLMARAGCRLVIVGFESANQQILDNIKKGITIEQMRKFAENVRKAGILLHADFIFGLPGETRETIKQTIKFIKKIKPEILQISIATPFPGTELYEWLKKNNYLLTDDPNEYLDDYGHQRCVVSYPWLPAEEIEYYLDKALREYYLSISYTPIMIRQIARRHGLDELMRMIRAMKVFIEYLKERRKATLLKD